MIDYPCGTNLITLILKIENFSYWWSEKTVKSGNNKIFGGFEGKGRRHDESRNPGDLEPGIGEETNSLLDLLETNITSSIS